MKITNLFNTQPAYKPTKCPHCGTVAHSLQEEMSHMESKHPEIIASRLEQAKKDFSLSSSWDD